MSNHTKPTDSLRKKVFWWLERPERDATGPFLLELGLIALITLNVAAVILETVTPIYQRWQLHFDLFGGFALAVFVVEYILRLWVAPENPKQRSQAHWAVTAVALIDLLAIIPAFIYVFVPIDLRVLRTFRMLRLLKLTRYYSALSRFRGRSWSLFRRFLYLDAHAYFCR